ncbi:MAG: YdeI/OmpD-associated family protein [Saprospiraceae bacterium]|nr:YdeI/OmpD-associated family protein [Saprospiraceae bacterium]
MRPTFFATPEAFRQWLAKHHATSEELIVGYYKKATGKPSMTWDESVDEALCYGWIDGIRRRIDDEAYSIRFTPRRPDSHWSDKNIKRMQELIDLERVQPPGLAAYAKRKASNSRKASYEQKKVALSKEFEQQFKANAAAWADWQQRPPGYRKQTAWWVMSAKRESTRQRRLGILIDACAKGKVIPPLRFSQRKK